MVAKMQFCRHLEGPDVPFLPPAPAPLAAYTAGAQEMYPAGVQEMYTVGAQEMLTVSVRLWSSLIPADNSQLIPVPEDSSCSCSTTLVCLGL